MTRPFDITAAPLPNGTLVEASAGTGKTHAVAAYVTKALATTEDLRIGEIIVTTFTRNAVAELRERIRARLIVTARLLRGEPAPTGYRKDELDDHLVGMEAERGVMASRLERAAAEFDTAMIGTMHSVCTRVLRLAGVNAAETGDEDLRDRVLEEVVNDEIVRHAQDGAQEQDGHLLDEAHLRDIVALCLADPFLEMDFSASECPADQRHLLERVPAIVRTCVERARGRMRASPSFDELLVRAWREVTVQDGDLSLIHI